MKKLKKIAALVLSVATVCTMLAACGGKKVDGTYTAKLDSKTYFAAQEVKNDMPETEKRPDGTDAMVPFSRLFGMLDDRIAGDGVTDYYTATLELSGSNYKLTKKINVDMDHVSDQVKGMMSGDSPVLELTFSGTFKADGTKVTLAAPTKVEGNVSPVAGMADAYTRFGGTYTDLSETSADADMYPGKFFYYFNTLYFVENAAVSDMTVTLDQQNNSFSIG